MFLSVLSMFFYIKFTALWCISFKNKISWRCGWMETARSWFQKNEKDFLGGKGFEKDALEGTGYDIRRRC